MSTTDTLTTPFCLITAFCMFPGIIAPKYKDRELPTEILPDEPLTITFRQILERPQEGVPCVWCWSINSAGQAELTIETSPKLSEGFRRKPTRRKLEISAEQMAAIRQVLHDERFFRFKENYGPIIIHGGWATLTVTAGQRAKSVRYSSSWGWVDFWERAKLAEAIPAVNVWLKVCEVVDPDGKVFEERQNIAEVIRALKK